ncbi:MAG TPA: DedA family protein [Gemmatimonadaceae bacterium]|nr:DedA family protein [Gemmatimonadaceae bacterium]
MQHLLDWLTSLPPAALYAALALVAAVENVFPPIPADTVVAFGAFIATRGNASVPLAFLSTWIGNVAGAMLMYALGRRYGAERLMARLAPRDAGESAEARVRGWYGRRGVWALALSRFLPGARALVPPLAGALRVPPLRAGAAIALASAVWYGGITYLAYRVGDNWDALSRRVGGASRTAGVVAAVVVALVVVVLLVRRHRARRAPAAS